MIFRPTIFISLFSFLFITSAYAAQDWCIEDPSFPPCSGRRGSCTKNLDGSDGGFVEASATVESVMVNGLKQNIPYIGVGVTICDYAQVSGNAQITEDAYISGTARVSGNAQVRGDAMVFGNAEVSGSAKVYEEAQVYGDASIYENAQIYGDAHVYVLRPR